MQPGPAKDEPAAFRELADRCDPALTLVADRGFEGYNNFAHCIERGVGFVVRLTDAFAARLLGAGGLPDGADEDVELLLSRSQRASLKAEPGYRRVSPSMKFDYLEGEGSTYRMRLRVVRIAIGGGRFENLATSLGRAEHGPGELGEIYALRWGIETAFRGLKHAVGLARLHSAGFRGAAQEVYARMVLYNFCSAMAALAQLVVEAEPREGLKHPRAVNFAAAVRACRAVLWPRAGPADGLLERIAANVCPVRPGRSFARHRRPPTAARRAPGAIPNATTPAVLRASAKLRPRANDPRLAGPACSPNRPLWGLALLRGNSCQGANAPSGP